MGKSLKDVIREAHGLVDTKDLPVDHPSKKLPEYVLPHHRAWMNTPERDRGWTTEAVEYAYEVFKGGFKHPREARFSPSSLGDDCERALLFSYWGAPKEPFPTDNAEKMAAGEFHHLRWQMEGLSAGYMDRGEVWLHSEELRCGGSADARLADGSLFELKSTADHLWKALKFQSGSALNYVMNMHRKHLFQIDTYLLVDEVGAAERGEERLFNDYASLVYMNAGSPGDLLEFRLHRSPEREKEVHRVLESLTDWVNLNQLPDLLEGCRKAIDGTQGDETLSVQEARVYNGCAYREHCPTASGGPA